MTNQLPLANMILADHFTYVMAVLCFIYLLIEYFVFWLFQKSQPFSFLKIFGHVLLANIASLIVRIFATIFIPPGIIRIGGRASAKEIFLGIIIVFFISWFIEYHVIRILNQKSPFPKLAKTIYYANLASYCFFYITLSVLKSFE